MHASLVPCGGKTSLAQSPVVAAELARFNAYKSDLLALPPVNSNAAAHAQRVVAVKHNPKLASLFRSLNLSF